MSERRPARKKESFDLVLAVLDIMKIALAFALGFFLAIGICLGRASASSEVLDGPYRAKVVEVYDGDTFTANINIWLGQWVGVSVRINGRKGDD